MNCENEDLSESRPEVSKIEAALAQLRPRREARFADEVKNCVKGVLSDKTPQPESVTATVKIPLTHYIRIAQFNAAAGGLLAGLLIGVLLGGVGVYFVMSRFDVAPPLSVLPNQTLPGQASYAASSRSARGLWDDDLSLTPLERSLLDKLDSEHSFRQRQVNRASIGHKRQE